MRPILGARRRRRHWQWIARPRIRRDQVRPPLCRLALAVVAIGAGALDAILIVIIALRLAAAADGRVRPRCRVPRRDRGARNVQHSWRD